jgi:hypothetical protein
MDAKAAKVPTGWLTIMSILGPACAARAHQVVDRWQGGPALGWQPSRFLADRGEAERAFALAERLGSVNAATHLGTTWLSLRKAFTRHGLGMPARNPEAVHQRAIATASRRAGRPATPTLGPVFASLNPGALPAHGQRTSCTSGSAARSSTPSWAPTWWSSCTARVTPANNHRV